MALTRRYRPADLASTFAGLAPFEGLEAPCLEDLASMALCHEYPRNNILSYRGDPAGPIHLVVSGRVKLILTNDEGREVIVAMLGPGGLFGLTSALDGGEQMSSAVTMERCTVARFKGAAFLRWCDGDRDRRIFLLTELARRSREANTRIGAHALMSAKDRLLDTLLEIAELEGEECPESDSVAFTRPTHQELAQRIGSSREVVTRLLAELRDADFFEDDNRVIRVPLSALVLRD